MAFNVLSRIGPYGPPLSPWAPNGPLQDPYKRWTFLRMPREGELHDVYLELLHKHDVYLEVLNKHDVYFEDLNKHDVYLEVLNKHACLFRSSK